MKPLIYRLFAILFYICAFVNVWGQSEWINEDYRNANFPTDIYYTYYYYKYNEGGDVNKTIDSAIREVQALLASSISSKVSSNSRSSVRSINNDIGYTETEEFYNDMQVASDAHLINVHTEYYYDMDTEIVHAFAYVKRSELITFLDSHIYADLSALGEKINGINTLLESGYKKEANERFEELMPILNSLKSYLTNLMSVDAGSPRIYEYSRRIEEYTNVIKKINSDMAHNMAIYFEAKLESPFEIRNFIPDRCKGLLSPHGFSFVSSPTIADYIVEIVCTTRTSSVSGSTCYAYVDIDINIVRGRDSVSLYENSLSIKGGALTEEKAHRKAMQNVPDKIVEQILSIVNE